MSGYFGRIVLLAMLGMLASQLCWLFCLSMLCWICCLVGYLVYAARLAMVNLMAGSARYAGYDGKLHWLAMLIG
jgi:hypothetical protein